MTNQNNYSEDSQNETSTAHEDEARCFCNDELHFSIEEIDTKIVVAKRVPQLFKKESGSHDNI